MFKKEKKIFCRLHNIHRKMISLNSYGKCALLLLHYSKKEKNFFFASIDFWQFFFFALTATATYWKKIRTTITTNVIHKRLCRVIHSRESRGPGKSRLPLLRPKCPLMTLRHYPPKLGRLLQSWPMKELVWVGGWF